MVIKDIDRNDVEFICKTIGCQPVAHIEQLVPEKLGKADLIEEVTLSDGARVLKISGVNKNSKTMTVLLRGSNQLVLDESDRSFHDALCVVRALIKSRGIIPGGGAPEIELAQKLDEYSRTLPGIESSIVRHYASALEVIPYTLAENSGLNPI